MLTLDEIKTHLRIEGDDTTEDAYLSSLGFVAWEFAENFTNRPICADDDALKASTDKKAILVTQGIKQAMLLLIGHYYSYREATTTEGVRNLPLAVNALLGPYRALCV